MGWGILEDRHMATPPGTSNLGASKDNDMAENDTANSSLKRRGDVILQPQPSDSPNDPLNWSPAWKESIMIILAFASGVTTALGPMITPGIQVIAMKYKVSLDLASSLIIGLLAFWIGFTTFFTASGANIWGKRPFFVISTVFLFATNVWGYYSTSFVSLAAMRTLQGIASAPLETLVTSTVSDMYFVHERGLRLSIWGCMLGSGVLLGQTIAGLIIQNISIEATFGISALIFIPLMFLMYFVVVETSYNGPRAGTEIKIEEKGSFWTVDNEERETYGQKLALFRGRISNDSFWKGVVKPFPLIVYPAVLFSTIIYGSYFAWLITISVLSVSAFGAAPYNLNPAQIGATNLPLLGVSLVSSPLSGWAADAVAKFMARRNNGIFEPEFRLTLMLIAAPLACIGLAGFGISVQNGTHISVPIFFMAMHSFSVPFASQASLAYVIDCHPKDANQAFVTINFTKAVFIFLSTTYSNGWMAAVGPRNAFVAMSLINLGFCSLTIPSYIYGKRFRSLIARSSFGQKVSGG